MYKLVIILVYYLFIGTTSAYSQNLNQEAAQKQTIELVTKAKDYIDQHGKAAAIEEFNNKKGIFIKNSYYIFALDYDGKYIANPYHPELLGTNVLGLTDESGNLIIRQFLHQATISGGGWVKYKWKNPVTAEILCKHSYVLPIENHYLIGSGYYYPTNTEGKCEQPT